VCLRRMTPVGARFPVNGDGSLGPELAAQILNHARTGTVSLAIRAAIRAGRPTVSAQLIVNPLNSERLDRTRFAP